MKILGAERLAEYAQMRGYELSSPIRPERRLLLWTGIAGDALTVSMQAQDGTLYVTDVHAYFDLGAHYWILRLEAHWIEPPFDYRIHYCADPEGIYATAAAVAEADWILLASGRAETEQRFVARISRTTAEADCSAAHGQNPLFMRYVRITTEVNAAGNPNYAASSLTAYPDTSIDLTGRMTEGWTLERRTDEQRMERFERPEFRCTLTDADGKLRSTPPGPPAEAGGYIPLTKLARLTFDVRYRGPNYEVPRGLDGTGWWPVFAGHLRSRRRGKRRQGGGRSRTVSISARSGQWLRGTTTQPLHEQMTPEEFLTNWLTVEDGTGKRLMGAKLHGATPVETSFEEFVGKTRIFGNQWWDPVVGVKAEEERLIALTSSDRGIVGITALGAFDFGGDARPEDITTWTWNLVRWDFAGREVERVEMPVQRNGQTLWYHDLCAWGSLVVISAHHIGGNGGVLLALTDEQWTAGVTREWGFETEGKRPCAIAAIREGHNAGGFVAAMQSSSGWGWRFFAADGEAEGDYPQMGEFAGSAPRCCDIMDVDGNYLLLLSNGSSGYSRTTGLNVAAPNVRVERMRTLSFDPLFYDVFYERLPDRSTTANYVGLSVQRDYVLAGGFSPEGIQEVAKVARLGWPLENGYILSTPPSPPVNGGEVLNWATPRVRMAGQILTEGVDYELDRVLGHLTLRKLPPTGQEIRASYDYRPTFGLVKVDEQARWDVCNDVAGAFGLVLTVDAFDRLCVGPREYEERLVVPTSGRTWRLGAAERSGGLAYIVAETIRVLDANGTALPAADYTLTAVPGFERGLAVTFYEIALTATAERLVAVKFVRQQTIHDLTRSSLAEDDDEDVDRLITRAVVKGSRRVPGDYPQRLVQVFAVGPLDAELTSEFDRVVPVQGTQLYDWNPKEKIYEGDAEQEPRFHIRFEDPLLLGGSEFAIVSGKQPVYYNTELASPSWGGKRFRRIDFAAGSRPASADYHVWIAVYQSVRLATAEDFESIHGNVFGGDGQDPANADDIKTTEHFYLCLMNALAGTTRVIAYDQQTVKYRKDAAGRLVRAADGDAETRYPSLHTDKRVRVTLRPQDVNGAPLFEDPIDDEARMVVEDCEVTSGGLRLRVLSYAKRTNFLEVEVIGYPVAAAEMYLGIASDGEGLRLYGEQPRRVENEFLPNAEFAKRRARQIVDRRAGEQRYQATRLPCVLVPEDSLVRVVAEDGTVAIKRTLRLYHSGSRQGSTTDAVVE